jgi:hypothetical protein
MQLIVTSQDAERTDEIYAGLFEDLKELDLTSFHVELQRPPATEGERRTAKGDPVSIYAIVLALVSAGGALTVAVGKEGLLTRIASVLDSYVQRKINIKIKRPDGTEVELAGPPQNIERILYESLERESRE